MSAPDFAEITSVAGFESRVRLDRPVAQMDRAAPS